MAETVDELKKQVFFEIMNMAGRVFIAVAYHDNVVIGRRGFLPQEKEQGLVLVFNKKMKFTWDDYGIATTLVFGQTPEKCFIPQEHIMTVFSPELNVQFSTFLQKESAPHLAQKEAALKPALAKKVIKVDFSKKKP